MKKSNLLYIAIILLMCFLPAFLTCVNGPSEAMANEIQSSKPVLIVDGRINDEYLTQLSDFAGDNYALRNEFITLWADINAKLFNSSSETQVIKGRGEWLFYSSTIDDFSGLAADDAKLFYMANNLRLIQEYAENNGSKFVFTVAPNKNSLYPEYMPGRFSFDHDDSNAVKLKHYLEMLGVNYADLFQIFEDEPVLYYSTDSHWNEKGAALAADAVLSRYGIETDYYSSSFVSCGSHKGDLYEMLYPKGTYIEDAYATAVPLKFSLLGSDNGGNAITIRTEQGNGSGRLLCWRDSFGSALYPYLADSFESAVFTRSSEYDLRRAKEEQADFIIIELVERNLPNLIKSSPVLPAQKISAPSFETGEGKLPMKTMTTVDGLYSVTGKLPEDVSGSVYVLSRGECYEAFVVFNENGTEFSILLEKPAECALLYVENGYYQYTLTEMLQDE